MTVLMRLLMTYINTVVCLCTDLLVDMDTLEFGEIIGQGSFAEVHKGR